MEEQGQKLVEEGTEGVMSTVDKNTPLPVPTRPRACPKSKKLQEAFRIARPLTKEKANDPSKMKGEGGNAERGRPAGSGTTGNGTVNGSVGMGLKRTGTFTGKEAAPKPTSSPAPKRSRPSASSTGTGSGSPPGPQRKEKADMEIENGDSDSDAGSAYELHYILEERTVKEYRCKWKGRGEKESNWIHEDDLYRKEAISEFEKRMAFQKNRNGKEVAREKKQGQGGRGRGSR